VLSAGGSQSDAAAASGVTVRTVASWLADWRRRFGDDVTTVLPLTRAESVEKARLAKFRLLSNRRTILMERCADNIEAGSDVIHKALKRYQTSVFLLEPGDLERLSRVVQAQANILATLTQAEAREPEPDLTRAGKPDLAPIGEMAALEPGEDSEIDDIMAGLDEAEKHWRDIGMDGNNVIDTESRLAS
jgi:hypothetical protein